LVLTNNRPEGAEDVCTEKYIFEKYIFENYIFEKTAGEILD
jgi:hypothetical protein